MSTRYKVVGPCAVAGVAPGGTVTREQVESHAGPDRPIQFDVLIGTHLEEVKADSPATDAKADPKKTAPK